VEGEDSGWEEGTGNRITCVVVIGEIVGAGDWVEGQKESRLEKREQVGGPTEDEHPPLDQNP
jgi:hypothetical protein